MRLVRWALPFIASVFIAAGATGCGNSSQNKTIYDQFGGVKKEASSAALPDLTIIRPKADENFKVGENIPCAFEFATNDVKDLPSVVKVSLVRDGVTRAEAVPDVKRNEKLRLETRLTAPDRIGKYQIVIEGWNLETSGPDDPGRRVDVLRETIPIQIAPAEPRS